MSTWFDASTGILVSCETSTGSSFTFRRLAYSFARSHAGPDQCSPPPVVFSISHGAFASTPTRKAPAFLMASTRGLLPGAGTSWAIAAEARVINPATASRPFNAEFITCLPFSSTRDRAHEGPSVAVGNPWKLRRYQRDESVTNSFLRAVGRVDRD